MGSPFGYSPTVDQFFAASRVVSEDTQSKQVRRVSDSDKHAWSTFSHQGSNGDLVTLGRSLQLAGAAEVSMRTDPGSDGTPEPRVQAYDGVPISVDDADGVSGVSLWDQDPGDNAIIKAENTDFSAHPSRLVTSDGGDHQEWAPGGYLAWSLGQEQHTPGGISAGMRAFLDPMGPDQLRELARAFEGPYLGQAASQPLTPVLGAGSVRSQRFVLHSQSDDRLDHAGGPTFGPDVPPRGLPAGRRRLSWEAPPRPLLGDLRPAHPQHAQYFPPRPAAARGLYRPQRPPRPAPPRARGYPMSIGYSRRAHALSQPPPHPPHWRDPYAYCLDQPPTERYNDPWRGSLA